MIDYVFRTSKTYYPRVFLEELIKMLLKNAWVYDIEISSDSDREDCDEENFDEEILVKNSRI